MSQRVSRSKAILIAVLTALFGGGLQAVRAQSIYNASINTTGLGGTNGLLAFDLVRGGSTSLNNLVTITSFATDGMLVPGGNANTPGAIGDLPGLVTIANQGFFNESARGIAFGTYLSFTISLTENLSPPGTPDQFSFFLLNPGGTGSAVLTGDPTGADSLFTIDILGEPGGALTVYNPITPNVSWSVLPAQQENIPEPSTLALALAGLFVGAIMSGHRFRRRRSSAAS